MILAETPRLGFRRLGVRGFRLSGKLILRFDSIFLKKDLVSHGTPKDGPKQHSDDDGVEHFRRIEFFCVEEIFVGSCSVPVP